MNTTPSLRAAKLELLEPRRLLAAGDLIASFGQDGAAAVDLDPDVFGTQTLTPIDLAVADDGGLLLYGTWSDFDGTFHGMGENGNGLVKLTPDGRLDLSFGSDGAIDIPTGPLAAGSDTNRGRLFVLPDGDILLHHDTTPHFFVDDIFVVRRYNADGTPDEAWQGLELGATADDGDPTIEFDASQQLFENRLAPLGDGTFAAVWREKVITRFDPVFTGLPAEWHYQTRFDHFAADGSTLETVILSDASNSQNQDFVPQRVSSDDAGRIYATGLFFAGGSGEGELQIRRYLDNGTLDATYGEGGIATPPQTGDSPPVITTFDVAGDGTARLLIYRDDPSQRQVLGLDADGSVSFAQTFDSGDSGTLRDVALTDYGLPVAVGIGATPVEGNTPLALRLDPAAGDPETVETTVPPLSREYLGDSDRYTDPQLDSGLPGGNAMSVVTSEDGAVYVTYYRRAQPDPELQLPNQLVVLKLELDDYARAEAQPPEPPEPPEPPQPPEPPEPPSDGVDAGQDGPSLVVTGRSDAPNTIRFALVDGQIEVWDGDERIDTFDADDIDEVVLVGGDLGDSLTVDDFDVPARLYGGGGDDTLTGGGAVDSLFGGAGNDVFDAGDGDDRIYGDAGDDSLVGGSGRDSIRGGAGSDTLDGGNGNDLLLPGERSNEQDELRGGEGFDILHYRESAANLTLVRGENGINSDLEIALAGSGHDRLEGFLRADGGAGNDTLVGGAGGGSALLGGDGDDALSGEDGAGNYLAGGAGSDTLTAGDGDDTLRAGLGGDLVADSGGTNDLDFSDAPSAVDFDHTRDGNLLASDSPLGEVRGVFAHVRGSRFADTLVGHDGNSWLSGGDGDDTLSGNGGVNVLVGDGGTDRFLGAAGSDVALDREENEFFNGARGQDLAFGPYGGELIDVELVTDDEDDLLAFLGLA